MKNEALTALRRATVLVVANVVLAGSLAAQALPAAASCPDPVKLASGLEEPLATVRYLADDALEGRLAGSPGERCAGDYIADRLRALGLQGAGPGGSFFQDVPLASTLNPHAPAGTGRNVLALLEDWGDAHYALPDDLRRKLETRHKTAKLTLGVRPETIEVNRDSTTGIAGTVYVEEPLGSDIFLTVQTGNTHLIIRTTPEFRAEIGEPVRLHFNPAKLYFFDPETGQAL